MVFKLAALGIAGALGTLARYAVAGLVHRTDHGSFPWGTLAVNASGCFVAGFLWALFESRGAIASEVRTAIFIGFLGAFTTFSGFVLETGQLLRAAEWAAAAANVLLSNGLGFAAFVLGSAVARLAVP